MTKVTYTQKQLQAAYVAWVNAKNPLERKQTWHIYCDARDGLAPGDSSRGFGHLYEGEENSTTKASHLRVIL